MSVVKKVVGIVAIAALSYFAPGIGTNLAGQIGIGAGLIGSFVGATIGAVVVAAGAFVVQSVLLGGGSRAPDMEAGKINVKIPEPPRWLNCGRVMQGGGVLFAEFDAQGNLFYLIVHSDEIMNGTPTYMLDDVLVTLDAQGFVQQAAFRLKDNKEKDPATVDGEGKGYVQIWTTTYSETDPVPPRIPELDAALGSKWTADHRLVGTTFSVVKMHALEIDHRFKIYSWRGALGMGEPAVQIIAEWANVYDPRDPAQVLGDRTTYKPTRNAELVWAWFRTHPYGRKKPESSINWDKVAENADICDQTVTGLAGTRKRYEAGVSIVDSKRRSVAEQEILLAMDGQIHFDEQGRSYASAGHYYAPTLTFSRNRDIMAMATMEAQDGESETHGVVVRYTDPEANFTVQPSAAWLNPLYYDPATTPNFLFVDILACQDHGQAMTLAKAIGMRSQPRHKIGPTVNLRGLSAREERIVGIKYDNTFAGDYEIAIPVELEAGGVFTGFGAVPVDPSRWTLLPGEEQPKPVVAEGAAAQAYPAITGESVTYQDGVLRVDFPATPPRPDAGYLAEYIPTAEITGGDADAWLGMTVNANLATSGPVQQGTDYTVRYRYVTGGGFGPGWEYATLEPEQTVQPVTNLTGAGAAGSAQLTWRNPNDLAFVYTSGHRGTTATFANSAEIFDDYAGGVGQTQTITDTVAAGSYFYWVVAHSADGTAATPTGPVQVTVA